MTRPEQDFAWALGRCHAAESPESWGGLVDLAVEDPEVAAEALAGYLLSGSPEDEVVLHDDGWSVARLRASALPPVGSGRSLSMERLHIVSGGMKGSASRSSAGSPATARSGCSSSAGARSTATASGTCASWRAWAAPPSTRSSTSATARCPARSRPACAGEAVGGGVPPGLPLAGRRPVVRHASLGNATPA